jgi:inward rectifier potassium channel
MDQPTTAPAIQTAESARGTHQPEDGRAQVPDAASRGLPPRALDRDGNITFTIVGTAPHYLSDFYHYLIIASWPRFLGLVGFAYLGLNLTFAILFFLGGDCIANAEPGSFSDAFFFSVQTMATIGYGAMAPKTLYAHALVTVEALLGLLAVALATGLMFAKFSRPTARLRFSRVALITRRNGQPFLVFRVANARANQIVEASVKLMMLKSEITAEGDRMRRFHELSLARSQNPLFAMTWTVMHPIDEKSPLHGLSVEELCAQQVDLLVILVGIDGTFAQTIHARHIYRAEDIVANARFVDMTRQLPDGRRVVDLDVISKHQALETPS